MEIKKLSYFLYISFKDRGFAFVSFLSDQTLVLYYQNGLKYFLKKYSHCYMSVFFSNKYFNFPTQIYSYWKPLYSHLTVGQSPLRNGVLLVITVRKVHWPMGKDSGWKTSRGHKRLIFVEKIGDFSWTVCRWEFPFLCEFSRTFFWWIFMVIFWWFFMDTFSIVMKRVTI